jgi:hypothetical protein
MSGPPQILSTFRVSHVKLSIPFAIGTDLPTWNPRISPHGVGTREIRLSELTETVNREMLSEIQVQMLLDGCTDPATYTSAGIKQKYQIALPFSERTDPRLSR